MPQALPYIYLATAAIGTYVAVDGAHTQEKQAKPTAQFQAAQAAADAKAAEGAAQVEAARIRKAAKRQMGAQVAALAASGVDVNSTTAVKLNQELTQNAEQDAYLTILGGGDQAARLRQGGDAALIEGRSRADAYHTQGTSALLSFVGTATNYGNGWKRAPGGG